MVIHTGDTYLRIKSLPAGRMNKNAPPTVVYPSPGVQVQGQQDMAPQTQIVIVQAPTSPLEMSDGKSRSFLGLGATQLVVGILSIIFNIGAIASLSEVTSIIAPGIWCGILFILAGSFGIAGGKRKSNPMVVTFLVLSIISASASVVVLTSASISVAFDQHDSGWFDGDRGGAIACDAILVALGVAELVIAIVSSAICCGALCGRQQPTSIHYVNSSTGQINVAPPGAVVLQPAGGAVSQVNYPSQGHQGAASQGPQYALPVGYQPHDPPPYQQEPSKQDLADVHGVTPTHPAMHSPPP